MRHLVFFSSGAASWAAAVRVAERYGPQNVRLVFADTLIEDEDNYRFLQEGAADVGAELVWLKDGRTPWDVFRDVRFLGNTRVAACSHKLKQDVCRRYVEQVAAEGPVRLHLGMDWQEAHRMEVVAAAWAPLDVDFPLCWDPWLDRAGVRQLAVERGLRLPRLYDLGFAHANCGGFCVKAGQTAFKHLLETLPDRYRMHEAKEEELRQYLGKDVSILRDRTGGDVKPLTLATLRERVEASAPPEVEEDWGGCNCFIGSE